MVSSYQLSQNITQKYKELCADPNVNIKDLYDVTDKYFYKVEDGYDKLSCEKTIFDLMIQPIRNITYSSSKNIQQNMLKLHACAIYRYIEQDFDYIAGFIGLEGRGKSVASIVTANYLQELGMSFDIDKDMFFRGDATATGFRNIYQTISRREKGVIIFDEGKAFFDKRQSMNNYRIETLQEIASQRSKNNVMFINVGAHDEIDVYFRERRCKSLFMIPDRRLFINLQNRAIVGMGSDRFGLSYYEWSIRKIPLSFKGHISALLRMNTQYGFGMIPHLDKESYNVYKSMKDSRNSILDKMMDAKYEKRMGVGKGKKKVNPMEYQPLCDTTSSVGV